MKVTIRDVAQKTGYTVATVSRALNNNPMVNVKTRESIQRQAEEMGYIRNSIAQGLARQSMDTVGIIVPDITNPYFPMLIKGMQDVLMEKGYATFVCNSNYSTDEEKKLLRKMSELRVRGIILDPLSTNTYNILQTTSPGLPAIFISEMPEDIPANCIAGNNFESTVEATRYLIGLGHKKIAYFSGNDGSYTFRRRVDGYMAVMKEHFGEVDRRLIRHVPATREGLSLIHI